MCILSVKLGCPSTYLRPGSLNENGAWLPHPLNHTPKVFDRLVDSTKQICKIAESEGMYLLLEGGYVSPVYSAKKVNGKPLYKYAREGKDVEIKPTSISIKLIAAGC